MNKHTDQFFQTNHKDGPVAVTFIIVALFVLVAVSVIIAATVQKQRAKQFQLRQQQNLRRRQVDEIADIIGLLNKVDPSNNLRDQLWQYSTTISAQLGEGSADANSPIANQLQPLTSDGEIKHAKTSINKASHLLKQMQSRKLISPQQCLDLTHHCHWLKLETEVLALSHQAGQRKEKGDDKVAVRYLLSARDLLRKSTLGHNSQKQLLAKVESDIAQLRGMEEDPPKGESTDDDGIDRDGGGFPTTPDANKKQF